MEDVVSYFVSALPLWFSASSAVIFFAVLSPQRRGGSQRYAENLVKLRPDLMHLERATMRLRL